MANHAALIGVLVICISYVQANKCCNVIPWADPEWCHASNCNGLGCQFDNPDTTVDESKTQCEDISKCFCAAVAAWPSKNFCTILRSCKEAQADYEAARKKILAKQSGNPSEECVKALSLSICSYHFPTCLNDVIQYDKICHSTCSALNQTCSITLDEFAQVGSRCNLKKVDSTNAAQVRASG